MTPRTRLGAVVLTGITFALAPYATAQVLDIGPLETVDLQGVHTFDDVTISGGTLNIVGDTTLRVLGDFQILVEPDPDPGDPDTGPEPGRVFIQRGTTGAAGDGGGEAPDGQEGTQTVPTGQLGFPGDPGGDGEDAASLVTNVRINAQGDIFVDGPIVAANRRSGGRGGSGGDGGDGGDGFNALFAGALAPGGEGAPAGSGNNGGNGGRPEAPVRLEFNALGTLTFGPNASVGLIGPNGSSGGPGGEGGDGGRGGSAGVDTAFNGGRGAAGAPGGDGGNGSDSSAGGTVSLMARTVDLQNVRPPTFSFPDLLDFDLRGGGGASGGSGRNGGGGGSGGNGGGNGGFGGAGGNGGDGGNGGNGGKGGDGGTVFVRGLDVFLSADGAIQQGGFGGSAGQGGDTGSAGSGGRGGGVNFDVIAPSGMRGFDGLDGQPGENGADGTVDVTLLDDGAAPSVGNGDFSQGLAFFLESGQGTAEIVQVNDDPALQMSVDAGVLSLTQLVGTNGASGLQVDLDYAFVTPVGTLEVVLDDNPILSITPAGVTSPVATPTVIPGAPFSSVSLVWPAPVAADSLHELSLRLLPGSPATVQIDNLAVQPAALSEPVVGDIDGDGDVDRDDLNLILAARNLPANGANDPRDLDGDGVITVLDARIAATLCTRPRCATA